MIMWFQIECLSQSLLLSNLTTPNFKKIFLLNNIVESFKDGDLIDIVSQTDHQFYTKS